MLSNSLITIAFSSHRVESIPFAKKLMEDHDFIILEEAQNPLFTDMLIKKISIDSYIREEETEFPEFSRRYYKVLRELYKKGKIIVQIEPYIEQLMNIHSLFSAGKKPTDIMKIKGLSKIYETERKATATLLYFYETSLRNNFQTAVEAVKKFARDDAERFRLRDTMRAKAISKILIDDSKVYIEAGGIHIYLENILNRISGKRFRIKTTFLLEPVIRKITGERDALGPGDLLTIHYILNKKKNDDYETLLAARSLIYIKLIIKEEILPSRNEKTPHTKDEIMANEMVKGLTAVQCEELFKKIRFQNRQETLEILYRYSRGKLHL